MDGDSTILPRETGIRRPALQPVLDFKTLPDLLCTSMQFTNWIPIAYSITLTQDFFC